VTLDGRVAMVTGAARGIGAAIAGRLSRLGASVAVCDIDDQGASETAKSLETPSISVGLDVSDRAAVVAAVTHIGDDLGPIDILVNNAGSLVARFGISDLTEAHLDDVFALNLKSAVLASQAAAPSMIERRRGTIVNVVSIAGHTGGGPGAGTYAAAKAALTSYTRSLAKELAPHGVRVNAVSPGVIDTPFHEVFSTPEMIRNFVSTIPLGRVGTAIECANVIAFLASDLASYIVGATIDVNGGQLMR
jgi:3-oxoacyl-[acyl-carrier protein] reductase